MPGMLVRKRLVWLAVIVTFLFLSVIGRVARLAIVDAAELTARGARQWTRAGTVAAERGSLLDRNGELLAHNVTAYIVTATPRLVTNAEQLLNLLCPLLGLDRAATAEKLQNRAVASVTLKRQVTRDMVDTIRELASQFPGALSGISFDRDSLRFYPYGQMLSQVLGLTNIDGEGQSGLELRYDAALRGTPGKLVTEVDAKSRALPDGESAYVAATPGNDVVLTIDSNIQSFVERALRECIAVNGAKNVMALVMDTNTGAILAAACHPSFDPNEPPRSDLDALQAGMRLRMVADVYEPGSTFKIITASAALDTGKTNPDEGFYCSGTYTVDGDRIRCWKNSHGAQTMAQALMNSCNPVFTELGLRVGAETLYQYLYAFGLGARTGIDLPGESAGLLIPVSRVKNVDLARIGFGQSVTVTPIQMISAACAVVNGGRLMRPYLVERIVSAEGEVIEQASPKVISTPISPETSATMRLLLERVVAEGGGRNAAIEGYRIGGKTGTAQLYRDGRIVTNVHIGSFVGFAPADDPQFAVLVIVDEASLQPDYGGTTAAPFARQIIGETLGYLGIRPETEANAVTVAVPDVTGMALAEAVKALKAAGLSHIADGDADTVRDQLPAMGAIVAKGSMVMLYVAGDPPPEASEFVLVPDLSGLSIAEANRLLRVKELTLLVEGSGLVTRQTPAAGAFVAPGTSVTAIFSAR